MSRRAKSIMHHSIKQRKRKRSVEMPLPQSEEVSPKQPTYAEGLRKFSGLVNADQGWS